MTSMGLGSYINSFTYIQGVPTLCWVLEIRKKSYIIWICHEKNHNISQFIRQWCSTTDKMFEVGQEWWEGIVQVERRERQSRQRYEIAWHIGKTGNSCVEWNTESEGVGQRGDWQWGLYGQITETLCSRPRRLESSCRNHRRALHKEWQGHQVVC